jgi:hypothetical protein
MCENVGRTVLVQNSKFQNHFANIEIQATECRFV